MVSNSYTPSGKRARNSASGGPELSKKSSVNTLNSIVNHLAIFFDFSDIDDVMYYQLSEPIRRLVEKRFRDFVRINFAHTPKKTALPRPTATVKPGSSRF
jgi:hypothetical protein